jgi:hypothetical protein
MSLASIVVACLLFAPGARDSSANPGTQAQEQPQGSKPPQQPSVQEKTSPASGTQEAVKKPASKKPTVKKKAPPKKKVPTVEKAGPTEEDGPPKRVVRDGSTTEPVNQISPSVPERQASSQLQKTNDLLIAADTNLKSISGAQLNSDQEDMVKQVKTYMEQAKTAAEMGDLERANNLATKAQLLSAELVKK